MALPPRKATDSVTMTDCWPATDSAAALELARAKESARVMDWELLTNLPSVVVGICQETRRRHYQNLEKCRHDR